jgi:dTDP-4-amino-4,6-dideoxygalactose transaminase
MDPDDLLAKLTPRTRAIIVQHSFGIPADLPRLAAIAERPGLPILEDCAHAIGSTIGGVAVGRLGVASFYSFEASKPVFAGIGGSALVNDPALADRIRELYAGYTAPSWFKQSQILAMYLAHRIAYRPSTFWRIRALFRRVVALGLIPGNYHTVTPGVQPVEEFRQALGGVQRWLVHREIAALDQRTAHRRRVAMAYRSGIIRDGIRHPEPVPGTEPVYGRYPLVIDRKQEVLALAPRFRVELADWYATPVHPLAGSALEAAGYRMGACPNAERLTAHVISLPTGPLVDDAQIERAVRFFAAA